MHAADLILDTRPVESGLLRSLRWHCRFARLRSKR